MTTTTGKAPGAAHAVAAVPRSLAPMGQNPSFLAPERLVSGTAKPLTR